MGDSTNHIINLMNNDLLETKDAVKILEKLNDKKNEKSWNDNYISILASTCEKAQCYRYMHEKSSEYFNKLSLRFTYASMLLSLALSTFTLVTNEFESFTYTTMITIWNWSFICRKFNWNKSKNEIT